MCSSLFCFDSIDSLGIRCALGNCWLLPTFFSPWVWWRKISPMSMVISAMEMSEKKQRDVPIRFAFNFLDGAFWLLRLVFIEFRCFIKFHNLFAAQIKFLRNYLEMFLLSILMLFHFSYFHWILNCLGFKDLNWSQRGRRKLKLGLVVNSTVDPEWINWNQLMQRTFIVSMLALCDAFFLPRISNAHNRRLHPLSHRFVCEISLLLKNCWLPGWESLL